MSSGKSKARIIQLPLSPEKYIKTKARSLPIRECLINKDWKNIGMAHIFIARQQPSGNMILGLLLVDMLCMGIKDCDYHFNVPEDEYLEMRKDIVQALEMKHCEYNLAHNITYGAIEFAEDFGFKPHKDWAVAQYLLAEDTDEIEIIDLAFGDEEGRPRVIVTPEYPMHDVIARLNKVLGPGNFDIFNVVDNESGLYDDDNFDQEEVEIPHELVYGAFIDHLYALSNYPKEKKVSPQLKAIKRKDYHFVDHLPKIGSYVISEKEKTILTEMLTQLRELKPGTVSRLEALVKEYPGNMVLQNYLSMAYSDTGQKEKAKKLIEATFNEFPWYLFARANYGHTLLDNGKIARFVSVFGGVFDLKALYPERVGFHFLEFITFYTVVVRYYIAIDEIDNADYLMTLLKDMFLEFEDDRALLARKMITDAKLVNMFGSTDISVREAIKADKPRFRNKTMKACYEGRIPFSPGLFAEILAIKKDDLIHDLREGIVKYLQRAHLNNLPEDLVEHDDLDFVLYAYFLLAELDRPELLRDLLFILGQPESVLQDNFGDLWAEKAWMPLCRLGRDQMPAMVEFCKEATEDTSQIIITETFVKIAILFPKYREPALASLLEIAQFCLTEPEERFTASDFVSNLVCDLADLQDPTLLPTIKALYDKGFVDYGYAGTYKELEPEVLHKTFLPLSPKLENIFELWDDIQVNWRR